MVAVGISCFPRPRVIDDPELKEQVEFVGADPLSNDPVVVEMDDGQSPVWSRHRSWERARRLRAARSMSLIPFDRRSRTGQDGSSVTCSRPEISMTSPFWTLKVTLETSPGPGLLLRISLTPSPVMTKVPLCPAPGV